MKNVMVIGVGVALLSGAFMSVTNASHSWNGFHWARTASPFTLQLGDNVSSTWDGYLATAANDWSVSAVLDTIVATGATKASNCKATSGRVEVCSSKYGNTGWLGVAQVWVSGSHITKGTVKLNDTYFNTRTYNTPAWRNLVMCQEVGHTLGLDHQDEKFDNANLNTCMDYTNDPSGTLYGQLGNEHPNQHDYDELAEIYAHVDSTNTVFPYTGDAGGGGSKGRGKPNAVGPDIDLNNPSAWGQAIRQDARGNNSVYVRNLGGGEKLFTFVTWAQ